MSAKFDESYEEIKQELQEVTIDSDLKDACERKVGLNKKSNEAAGNQTAKKNLNQCPYCPRTFVTSRDLKIHQHVHTEQLGYHCGYCPSIFSDKSNFTTHVLAHTKTFPFKCNKCLKRYLHASELKRHLESHHESDVEWNKVKPVYTCLVCQGSCNCATIKRKEPIQCKKCARTFVDVFELKIHMKIHTDQLTYKCPYCPLSFAHKSIIVSHMYEHTKYYPYRCNYCRLSYKQQGELNKHMLEKHQLTPKINRKANKQMETTDLRSAKKEQETNLHTSKLTPSNHNNNEMETKMEVEQPSLPIEERAGVIPHMCIYCMKKFSFKSDLFMHVRDVHPKTETTIANHKDNKHKCIYCAEEYRYRSQLFRHLRDKHNELTNLITINKCNYCPKEYRSLKQLRKHVSDKHHQLLKSATSEVLSEHKESEEHTENTFYVCIHCSKEFNDQSELLQHVHDTHPLTSESTTNNKKEPLSRICVYCSKEFSNSRTLYEHVLAEHPSYASCDKEELKEVEVLSEPILDISCVEETVNADPLYVDSPTSTHKEEKNNAKRSSKKVKASIKFLEDDDDVEPEPKQIKLQKSPKSKDKQKNIVTRLYKCNYCTKNFTRLDDLKKHLSSHAVRRSTRAYKCTRHAIF